MAAHADWSAHPGKRWVTRARRDGAGWLAADPAPVGEPMALGESLLADGPAVLGLDVPLGVPRLWAATRSEPGFVDFLRGRAGDARFFTVAEALDGVSPAAPFYPRIGVKGMTRAGHAAALGLADAAALSRWCDRATAERPAGAPVFWTLGANQSGKAAIACWRDWLAPALAAGAPYAIWPFDGALHALVAPGRLVLAEVYPAQALRVIGVRLAGSKRDAGARRAAAPAIRTTMARLGVRGAPGLEEGFGADPAGEDRFDSLLGLLNLVAVLDGHAADFVPDDAMVRRWEGWVLGQRALPQDLHAGSG